MKRFPKRFQAFLNFSLMLALSGTLLAAPPANYYSSADTSSMDALRSSLHQIVQSGHVKVGYTPGVWDALQITDEDPTATDSVRLIYTGQLRPKSDGCSVNVDPTPPPCNDSDAAAGGWNREHAFCQSKFASDEPMESDLHHIFPIDGDVNSQRNDNPFGIVEIPTYIAFGSECDNHRWEVRPDQRGDIARALFYMDIRYEGDGTEPDLRLVDTEPGAGASGEMGHFSTLLAWHIEDPPDAFEQTRNDRVFDLQGNRNPFVDRPEWVAIVYNQVPPNDGDSADVSFLDRASGARRPGETFPMLSILLAANSHEWDLGQIKVENTGTIASNGLTVKAYKDANRNGEVDEGEALLGSSAITTSTVTLSLNPSARASTSTITHVLLAAEIVPSAVPGQTVAFHIPANGLFHASSGGADLDPVHPACDSSSITLIAPKGIFFSEYIEGSSNNKALEIYNDSQAGVDFSTGSGWHVRIAFNGNPPSNSIPLSGILSPGHAFVLAHSSSAPAILAVANQTSGALIFNGDDAVYLEDNTGAVVDSIGQVGFDPGTEWGAGNTSTADNTLRRKPWIVEGDALSTDTFNPANEWNGFAVNTFDGLSTHVIDHTPVPGVVSSAIFEDIPGIVAVAFTDCDDSATPTFSASAPVLTSGTLGAPVIVKTGTGAYEARFLYTPPANQYGIVTFNFSVADASSTATAVGLIFYIAPVNDLPTISPVSSLTIPKNGSSAPVLFSVGDVETPAEYLIVSGESSDETLLPLSGFAFSGTGANRQVILTPAPGQSGGPIQVTLRVEDEEGDSAETSFEAMITAPSGVALWLLE